MEMAVASPESVPIHLKGPQHMFAKMNDITSKLSSCHTAGPRSAIGRAPDSQVRGPGFDTRSGNILSFLLPLFQEGQLSVTGESMCTKYWLTA